MSTTEYRAPTVSLEDQVFTFGWAKDDAKLELVKQELGKYDTTQTWNNGAEAARAFETSKEPVNIKPIDPPFPTRFIHNTNTDCAIKAKEDPV